MSWLVDRSYYERIYDTWLYRTPPRRYGLMVTVQSELRRSAVRNAGRKPHAWFLPLFAPAESPSFLQSYFRYVFSPPLKLVVGKTRTFGSHFYTRFIPRVKFRRLEFWKRRKKEILIASESYITQESGKLKIREEIFEKLLFKLYSIKISLKLSRVRKNLNTPLNSTRISDRVLKFHPLSFHRIAINLNFYRSCIAG